VIDKGTMKCANSVTLIKVLYTPSFPVNLLSICIIYEKKYIVTFDIPKMVFQEKGTGRILEIRTWNDGLWYLNRENMDTALAIMVDRVRAVGSGASVEDELFFIHRQLGHSSFNLLEHLYPLKDEKADKKKLVCDGCEFRKHTRSLYVSSRSRSSHDFDLIHLDVWESCSTMKIDEHSFFVTFVNSYTHTT
jgi:GAG-pre-integrase domain